MMEEMIGRIQRKEDLRKDLSTLRQQLKDEETKKSFHALIEDLSEWTALLEQEDPKVRKNAALLIKEMEWTKASKPLYEAYVREDKLFVRSAYLAALEKTGAYDYLSDLHDRYEELCGMAPLPEEKKHIQEEIKALEQIFLKEGKKITHTFCGWQEKLTVLLTSNPAYSEVTAQKIRADRVTSTSLGVKAVTQELGEILAVRTYKELLFPISIKADIPYGEEPEQFGKAVAESSLYDLLERCHKEPAPFYFRMEIRGGMTLEQRSRYAKRAAAAIEEGSGRRLINSTGDYEFELRLLPDVKGHVHLFLKMNTIPMERFAYRKNVIASSMQPSLAALLMELSKPYLKEQAQILDPCCGVGTLLIERNHVMPAREVYGLDIFGEAVIKARENAAAAGISANFINRDYFTFEHKYLFDEIIVNMPSRGKKSKEEMDEFYRMFFIKSQELLAPEGVILMYSSEGGFIKKQLRLLPEYKLYQEYEIVKKNHDSLYIIG